MKNEQTGIVTEAPVIGKKAVRIRVQTKFTDLAPGQSFEVNGEKLQVLEVGEKSNAAFLLHAGSKLTGLIEGDVVTLKKI
jgi:riboflavin synthase alpha subunit